MSCVKIPARVLNSKSAWAIYSILLSDEAERKFVQDTLKAENIPSAIYYPLPLHLQPAYHSYHDGTYLSVSEEVSKRILALPIHPELSNAQVNRVIQAVLKVKK